MSADLLRRAADRLREMANSDDVQHRDDWCPEYAHWAIRHVERNVDLDIEPCADHGHEHGQMGRYAGRYVAMMQPRVALVLANWLSVTAAIAQANDEHDGFDLDAVDDTRCAVEVARAILREDA